jgi:hypothetical protein
MFSYLLKSLSVVAGALALLLVVSLPLSGCSDDPVLGPDEGEEDGGGGSYSAIERLAPSDAERSPRPNPRRF